MVGLKLKIYLNLFLIATMTFFVVPSSHAVELRQIKRACQAWLQDLRAKPEEFITADFDESERVDVENLKRDELDSLVGRPVSYVPPGGFNWHSVGPILFHRPRAFSKLRRQAIEEVMQASFRSDWVEEARKRIRSEQSSANSVQLGKNEWSQQDIEELLREGIETSKVILTFTTGRTQAFDVATSYHPLRIALEDALKTLDSELAMLGDAPEKQIARIEIYHAHPGQTALDAFVSSADVNAAMEIAKQFANRNLNPQIHIFAISGSSANRLVGQFSVQLY